MCLWVLVFGVCFIWFLFCVLRGLMTGCACQVEPLRKECLSEEFAALQSGMAQRPRVQTSLLVTRGGLLDVNYQVYSPSGKVLYERLVFSNKDPSTGKSLPSVIEQGYDFQAMEEGEYKFCFDNTMSRYTAKVVEFEITRCAYLRVVDVSTVLRCAATDPAVWSCSGHGE